MKYRVILNQLHRVVHKLIIILDIRTLRLEAPSPISESPKKNPVARLPAGDVGGRRDERPGHGQGEVRPTRRAGQRRRYRGRLQDLQLRQEDDPRAGRLRACAARQHRGHVQLHQAVGGADGGERAEPGRPARGHRQHGQRRRLRRPDRPVGLRGQQGRGRRHDPADSSRSQSRR